jgi:hypothetical protein
VSITVVSLKVVANYCGRAVVDGSIFCEKLYLPAMMTVSSAIRGAEIR